MNRILLAIGLMLGGIGLQAETLKISTAYPDGTAILNIYKAAADRIEQDTEGRVEIKFYPGGVMGDDNSVLRKIRIGQLHGAIVQTGLMADVYPDSQIYNAPMLFRNFDEVDFIRSDLDDRLEAGILEGGWKTFGIMEGGFAYLVSVNPVSTKEDLQAQKFWIPSNDSISEKIAAAFDISPIVLSYGEVKTALETGAINALASPPIATISMQWFTRVNYLTDLPFMYTAATLTVSERYFNRLSEEDQIIVDQHFRAATEELDQINREDNLKAFDALLQQNIAVVEMDEAARTALEQEARTANLKLVEMGEFSADIYNEVTGRLEQFRKQ